MYWSAVARNEAQAGRLQSPLFPSHNKARSKPYGLVQALSVSPDGGLNAKLLNYHMSRVYMSERLNSIQNLSKALRNGAGGL